MKCSKCGYDINEELIECPECKTNIQQIRLSTAIEKVKEGDQSAFSDIYEITYTYVYQRAKYILKDEQEAQDLVQDVYLILYKNIHQLQSNESIFGWLKTVTFRQGLKIIEKRCKTVDFIDDQTAYLENIIDVDEDIELTYMHEQDMNFIKESIFALPDEQRLIVCAYYYDEMKVEEIATQFELSTGTVKSRLYLARKKLNTMLSAQEKKQGYKFYGFGAPIFTTAIQSIMEDLAYVEQTQKVAIAENLKALLTSDSTQEIILETAGTTVEVGEFVQTYGETLLKGIGTAILTKLAGIGAKKIAVSTVSLSIAAAAAVTGYNAVQMELIQNDSTVQQIERTVPEQEAKPESVQVQNKVNQAVVETEAVPEVEEFFYDEEEDRPTIGEELADPHEVEEDPYAAEERFATIGFVNFGEVSESHSFTLPDELQVSVVMLGTMILSNGIEAPVEGRYMLEVQDSAGNVVASTSGEMNGDDVYLTETLPKGNYDVYIYNLATEMDTYETLPYELYIYY